MLLVFQNLYSNSKAFIIVTALFLSVLAFIYIGLATNVVRGEYKIGDLQQKIIDTEKLNNNMRIDLTKVSSLEYISRESDRLLYVQIKDIEYLKKPTNSPFAQAQVQALQ